MADEPTIAAAKKQLATEREVSDKSRAEYAERMKGKPTPTQEENDLAILGAPVVEKEDDGSGPEVHTRSVEAEAPKPAATYQTRQARAAPAAPPRPSTTS
jgi:hypothetical protein